MVHLLFMCILEFHLKGKCPEVLVRNIFSPLFTALCKTKLCFLQKLFVVPFTWVLSITWKRCQYQPFVTSQTGDIQNVLRAPFVSMLLCCYPLDLFELYPKINQIKSEIVRIEVNGDKGQTCHFFLHHIGRLKVVFSFVYRL